MFHETLKPILDELMTAPFHLDIVIKENPMLSHRVLMRGHEIFCVMMNFEQQAPITIASKHFECIIPINAPLKASLEEGIRQVIEAESALITLLNNLPYWVVPGACCKIPDQDAVFEISSVGVDTVVLDNGMSVPVKYLIHIRSRCR